MTHYIAIIEDAGPDTAIGVWFPDLPGCFSAGDTIDEALLNAPEAVLLYAEALREDGRAMPAGRSLAELKADRAFQEDASGNLIALIALPDQVGVAAE